jgi:hypothetical protein
VTSCGTDSPDSAAVAAGDPGYAYQAIASMRANANLSVLEPHSLVDALPNREIVVRSDQGEGVKRRFSDVVAAGRITRVTPHEGILYPHADPQDPGDEEADVKIVAFDDPDAAERVALVTMQVEWSAGTKVGEIIQFRIGVPVGADPNKFLEGVRGIDDAVVLLDLDDAGRNQGAYRPILNSAGLGSVDDDGAVAFEGLGDQERDFTAGIDTLDELKAEASKPDTTLEY